MPLLVRKRTTPPTWQEHYALKRVLDGLSGRVTQLEEWCASHVALHDRDEE